MVILDLKPVGRKGVFCKISQSSQSLLITLFPLTSNSVIFEGKEIFIQKSSVWRQPRFTAFDFECRKRNAHKAQYIELINVGEIYSYYRFSYKQDSSYTYPVEQSFCTASLFFSNLWIILAPLSCCQVRKNTFILIQKGQNAYPVLK